MNGGRRWRQFGGIRGSVVRWARRYVNAHCINIVTYHSVAPSDGPFTAGIPQRHTPQELAAHMAYLRKHFRPTSLRRVIEALEAGRTLDRAVVVTFDDGFRDVLTEARPVLRQFAIPATVFVVTSVVGNGDLMWRHKLTWLVRHGLGRQVFDALKSQYRSSGLDADGEMFRRDTDATPDLYELTRRYFQPDIIPALLEDLLRRHGWSGSALAKQYRPYLDPQDVAGANPDEIEFGNHTETHPVLSALTPDQQLQELTRAKARLTEWAGRPPLAVAFPFGQRDTYNRYSTAAVARTGHRAALDLRRRMNAGPVSPFELSRKPAPRHDQMAFERLVEDWLVPPTRAVVTSPSDRILLSRRMFRGAPPPIRLASEQR